MVEVTRRRRRLSVPSPLAVAGVHNVAAPISEVMGVPLLRLVRPALLDAKILLRQQTAIPTSGRAFAVSKKDL